MGRAKRNPSLRSRGRMMVFAALYPSYLVSKRDRAGDAGRDVAADPGRLAVLRDVDAAGAAEHRALRRDIALRCDARADQPLRKTGIEAAGHRILTAAAHEGANLELHFAAVARRVPGGHDAERLVAQHAGIVLEREHLAARAEAHRDPAGTIVDPLRGLDHVLGDADRARDARAQIGLDLA